MDFSQDNDADLLGYMAEQAEEPECAKEAFGELYRRHVEYLLGVTTRSYGKQIGGEAGAEDLVQEAFGKAYRWTGRHGRKPKALDRFRGDSPEKTRHKVRLWLGRIVKNLFRDYLRCARDVREVELPENLGAEPAEHDAPAFASSRLEALRCAMEELKPEDQEALRVSIPWYDAATQKFTFPPGEAERVASSLGIEVDALRQRRHRALKRLRAAMNEQEGTTARTGARR